MPWTYFALLALSVVAAYRAGHAMGSTEHHLRDFVHRERERHQRFKALL